MALKKDHRTPRRHGHAAAAGEKRRRKSVAQIVAEVREIAREIAALPTLHDVDPDQWLYDERGLPH